MKTLRVKTNFAKVRDADLETVGQAIVSRMANNQGFPQLAGDVILVQTAHVAYAQALASASGGGTLATAIKKEAKSVLAGHLHDLGVKINLQARGNETLLESTGYPLVGGGSSHKKAAAHSGPLDPIMGMDFTFLKGTGCLIAAIPQQEGAGAYKWQYTPAPVSEQSIWITVDTTSYVFRFSGLTIGGLYAFRVAGIGEDPTPVFSEIATSYVI